MNRRSAVSSRLADAIARLRGVRRSLWLLAAAVLLLVSGMAGATRPSSMVPSGSVAVGATTPALLGAAAGATGTADAGTGAATALLADGPGTDLPGVADLVGKGLLVLALLLMTLRLLRRFSSAAGSATARLVVLESRPLAQRATLHLVAIGERRLVIGLTPNGLVSLADLTADELPDEIVALKADRTPDATELAGGRPVECFARLLADLAGRRNVVR